MMAINNVSMNNTSPSITARPAAAETTESKKLQNQLTNEQQRLNRLSSDGDMTASEKEKERREIQREIAELNRKLKQEHLEEKEEAKEAAKEQEKKKIIKEEMFEKTDSKAKTDSKDNSEETTSAKPKDSSVNTDLPVVNIKNVLTAASMVRQDTVQESAARQLENRKNVLEAEIQSDSLYGTDTTAKEEALSKLRKQEALQIEVLNQQPEQITPTMDFGSKIIIRE